ncbi:three-Cys-motif partner protein TcmP (plasmid) [Agrobacterium fabrum]|uniref:three-Cys-motif partner protein TcmP n=1 Tax=Agrobacterium fabrum TaxID=1176649 RepID=UPI001571FA1B|nr:three-Cys-motif partner protein TcmP [Agrobacterium fabrum]NTB10820.1 three-Cys-motif partner protein TcmP [Agrobacterium fabrum]
MVVKSYTFSQGAKLDDHTKQKHKILRQYFERYLAVRCQLPQQSKFRLAIVDGFAGGGRYEDGSPGSPIIFTEALIEATKSFNVRRAADKMAELSIECLLVLNDEDTPTLEFLKSQMAPLVAALKDTVPKLYLKVVYLNQEFETAYPEIKTLLETGRYPNVLFNLDQCGHAQVQRATLADIMTSFRSAEIFYTFMITSLLAFLQKGNPARYRAQLAHLDLTPEAISSLGDQMSNQAWLGSAERVVFDAFRGCAAFVSPFSINNPEGWRYWLIHFANNYRARQEYNNVLHRNSTTQAHFGRSGLRMLSYNVSDPSTGLYLFEEADRGRARDQLHDDIPRLVNEYGDAIRVGDFYRGVYNMTPAHADDIHASVMMNTDLEVITEAGGARRATNTITPNDVLRLKPQRSFFPMFLDADDKARK